MELNIEKNIPIPNHDLGRGSSGSSKYGFDKMSVGDSIFFAGETTTYGCKPYISAYAFGKKNGGKFSARVVDGGVRIWRVE